jgi:very-short-patch-repair endonuclease
MDVLPIFFVLVIVVGVLFLVYFILPKAPDFDEITPEQEAPVWEFASVYRKREYLFDSTSEFNLFRVLVELFGDQYYIFAQVNLGHLVETKSNEFFEKRKQRSRIEKKSVDFVLCDKVRVVPQLVIELDGYSHWREDRKIRDTFVNELMKDVGLPILHLQTNNLSKEFIKREIERVLK